jgi:signal transduction histidine kinase
MRVRSLQVLNRVLRHTIRNDANVIAGLAEAIDRRTADPTTAEYAATIRRKATGVADFGETARTIETVVREGPAETQSVPVRSVLAHVVSSARDDGSTTDVRMSAPPDLHVEVDDTIRRALVEIVENAFEHAPDSDPEVRIVARERPESDAVVVEIADGGAGIPDGEWAVITGEESISDLTHGSGLGLWLASTVFEAHGIDFARDSDADGERLVVELARGDIDRRSARD